MIRFRRLLGADTPEDKQKLASVLKIYQEAFSYQPEYAAKIADLVTRGQPADMEIFLLLAEGLKTRVLGFSLFFYFPEFQFGYVDYLASDPARMRKGIGAALYEATRDLLASKGAKGMFIDVPPDEKELLKEPHRLATNKKRLAFYERYNARPIINTRYEKISTTVNEGYPTFLVFDRLKSPRPLRRRPLTRFLRRLLEFKSPLLLPPDKLKSVLASFRDDPVLLRAPRYEEKEKPAAEKAGRATLDIVNIGDAHQIHHLKEKGYVERPARISALMKGLEPFTLKTHAVRKFADRIIREVHDAKLVNFLAKMPKRLSGKELVYPQIFPIRRPDRLPRTWEQQTGYFCMDSFTPLTANAYKAARRAVDGALTGADLLLKGAPTVYVLCRPPGHHAERKVYGGFCYLNNAAIAANYLSKHGKVALLDIDYHHGNGSQDIFYTRRDVLVVSIHGHPLVSYPYFSGFPDERGEGEGRGYNRNLPLFPGADDEKYLATLAKAVRGIQKFKPACLVVSLGLDFMRGDPTGGFEVTARGVQRVGEVLGTFKAPKLVIQEGGYSLHNLRKGIAAFFAGLLK